MATVDPLLLCIVFVLIVTYGRAEVTGNKVRLKRQEPEPGIDYVGDYAGNDEVEKEEPPKETFQDTDNIGDTRKYDEDINEDRFSAPALDTKRESMESVKVKKKKRSKTHKFLKATLEFLKKVLDPNNLMQNTFITEMLRKFSHSEDIDEPEEESEEEVHTVMPTRKKRGRPRKSKRNNIPPGITGLIKKGVRTLTKLELDRKKLRRRVRLVKRIAKKARKPLKAAVKIFLSSRNQNQGYGGGGGYGATNY